jgi:hypothetical protein
MAAWLATQLRRLAILGLALGGLAVMGRIVPRTFGRGLVLAGAACSLLLLALMGAGAPYALGAAIVDLGIVVGLVAARRRPAMA